MKDGASEDEKVPNGMIQVVVANEEGDTTSVSESTSDQKTNAFAWECRNQVG